MADGWKDIGKDQVVSFKIREMGLKWHDIPSMLLSKGQERLDVKQAVRAADAARDGIETSKTLFQRHKPNYLGEFLKLQRPTLDKSRECVQEGYNTIFINNAIRKRMLVRIQDFFNDHPEASNAKGRFERFLKGFKEDLFAERQHINGLQSSAKGGAVVMGAVKKRFFWSSGFFGKMYRSVHERNLISSEFKYEKRAEHLEKNKVLDEKQCYELISLLEHFHEKCTKLTYDIAILTLKLLDDVKDYEKAMAAGIERFDLPKSTKNLINFYVDLRKKSEQVFENEAEMINQLMGEEKETAKEAKKAFATGKLAFARG